MVRVVKEDDNDTVEGVWIEHTLRKEPSKIYLLAQGEAQNTTL